IKKTEPPLIRLPPTIMGLEDNGLFIHGHYSITVKYKGKPAILSLLISNLFNLIAIRDKSHRWSFEADTSIFFLHKLLLLF
ncbi:hypothetical protein WCU73_20760, partial [Pectobacterium brasiliense]|uniref:hypothetical protein n=1 Tax=Pectobacterium brasiliense TaxID=180957 RepID=UPI0030162C31